MGYLLQNGAPDLAIPSGPQTHIVNIIKALGRRGHRVRTVQLTQAGVQWSDDLAAWQPVSFPSRWRPAMRLVERPVRLAQTVFPWLPYLNFFDSLRFADAAQSVLSGFDVIYERFGFMGYGGVLLSRQMHIPLFLEVNGHPFDELRHTQPGSLNRLQAWVSQRITRWTMANAARVLPSGYGWEDRLVKTGLLDRSKSHVVWPGTDQTLYNKTRDKIELRERWQAGRGPVIVFVGSFDGWQGLNGLVKAFAQVLEAVPDATLILVGDGPKRQEVESLAVNSGCRNRVRFTERLEQGKVAEILAISDIAVMLYEKRAEFVGMKLFDYMASGTAIIVSAPNKQHPLIVDGETGLVIEPASEPQLSEALLRLLHDREFRLQLGSSAQQFVAQGHSWDHRAVEIEELVCTSLLYQK